MSAPDRERRHGYRNDRIARAVAETFECELLPALEDPILQDLRVIAVEVKGLACIHVLLGPGAKPGDREANEVEAALARAEGRMRMELAASLRVKRMPTLRLRYMPLPLWREKVGEA